MPTPSKPCEGTLSPETLESLRRNRNREQWGNHSCATCGRVVGVELVMGKWVTERHWPTVKYPLRKTAPSERQTLTSASLPIRAGNDSPESS
jgi:hypothetical protein